ncbi:NPC intracellular cholesterol transporter 2-like [Mytilus edulis]|uniref:NPC intracellular cholesterol transporter 2-like n=1 Tax=Mytilus edulis TaxID=6550 RepID=UPI0039EE5BB8
MMSPKTVVVILCFVVLQLVSATVFKDCGTNAGTLASVDVSDCPQNTVPCPFKRGTNVTLVVKLTPTEASKGATLNLYGIIAGIKTPFQTKVDACKSDITCPITQGQATTFTAVVYVQPAYPKLRLVVDVELTSDDGKFLVCVQVPAEITD